MKNVLELQIKVSIMVSSGLTLGIGGVSQIVIPNLFGLDPVPKRSRPLDLDCGLCSLGQAHPAAHLLEDPLGATRSQRH